MRTVARGEEGPSPLRKGGGAQSVNFKYGLVDSGRIPGEE